MMELNTGWRERVALVPDGHEDAGMTTPVEPARSFGAQAAVYDRVRPGYPQQAVAAVLPAGATQVVDVGAGTGKLTAALLERGLAVIAVEPDDEMRAVLTARVPAADARAGTAEALPVGDAEADAVVFGQSWHWADHAEAAAEAARVLRPGGTLGLLWNVDDHSVDWAAALGSLTGSTSRFSALAELDPVLGFCAGHRLDVAWEFKLPRDELVPLVGTWSRVSTLADADRKAVIDQVERLLDEHPALAHQDALALPHVCVALTYHLL
jgi:SAM-dependent methyltransferase